jgi:hypothetical protein
MTSYAVNDECAEVPNAASANVREDRMTSDDKSSVWMNGGIDPRDIIFSK